jgi:hypothetical protein
VHTYDGKATTSDLYKGHICIHIHII